MDPTNLPVWFALVCIGLGLAVPGIFFWLIARDMDQPSKYKDWELPKKW